VKKALIAMLIGFLTPLAIAQVVTRTATINWTAPTQNEDGSPITDALTYNLYQGAQGSTTKPRVATGLTTGSRVVSGLPAGTVCFEVTAVNSRGGESAKSNEACKSFPFPAPNAVTITVQ
jgi:hypothetical protein